MNQHVFGAERRSEPSPGETQPPEFDAMTWGADLVCAASLTLLPYRGKAEEILGRRAGS